jgi:hypothetical protein
MSMQGAALSTSPLSRADQAELLEYLPEGAVALRATPLAPGELGEPVTAIAVIALSMAAITGLCAWLGAKGRGFSITMKASAPGVSGEFAFTMTEQSKPEAVRAELAGKGIQVPPK